MNKGITSDPLAAHFGQGLTVEKPKKANPRPATPQPHEETKPKNKKKAPRKLDMNSPKIAVSVRVPIELLERLRDAAAYTPHSVSSLLVEGGAERLRKLELEFISDFDREIPARK